MKLKEIQKLIGDKVSAKKLKSIISKITPAEFKKEMKKNSGYGSIVNIIKRKLK